MLVVVIAFTTMGGEISFNLGPLITHLGLYISGVVGLVVVLVPPSMTILNQTHMETPVAQVMTIAQMSLRTGLFAFFFSHQNSPFTFCLPGMVLKCIKHKK